jgi:hypothetical protein
LWIQNKKARETARPSMLRQTGAESFPTVHISTGFFGFGEGSGTCRRRFAYQKGRNRLVQAFFRLRQAA